MKVRLFSQIKRKLLRDMYIGMINKLKTIGNTCRNMQDNNKFRTLIAEFVKHFANKKQLHSKYILG